MLARTFFFIMPVWTRRGRGEGSGRKKGPQVSVSLMDHSTTRNEYRKLNNSRKRYQSLILVGNAPHLCGYSMPWAV